MIHIDKQTHTPQELEQAIAKIAKLAQQGQWQNRRIAVCTRNIFSWLSLLLYCKDNGISVAPLHPDTPLQTARERAAKFSCDLLLWQELENALPVETEKGKAQTFNDAVLIQSSSGTTGEPKIIERSWKNIDTEIQAYNRSVITAFEMTPVIACPVTHAYGMICGFLASYARKQDLHIVTSLNTRFVLETLTQYRQTLLYSSPPFIEALIDLLPASQRLFAVMSSGTAISGQQIEKFRAHVHHLFQQYGCSEAGCLSIAYQPESGSCLGRPLSTWRILAGDDVNQAEEIIAEQNKLSIHTQDLGYFDERGQLHFVSRMDDTIVVSGYNVYPAEVEDILLRHPLIHDAIVFKLTENGAERVAAIYCADAALSGKDLRRWYNDHLPPHQWPTTIEYIDTIPRLPNGKVNRKNLAALLQDLRARKTAVAAVGSV